MEFHSSSSGAVNTRHAVAECLENALGGPHPDCDLIVFYTTMGHDFGELLGELRRLSPRARVAGCTCTGVTGREGANESMRALSVMAMRGPPSEFAVASVDRITKDSSWTAARTLAEELRRQNPRVNAVLLYPSALGAFPGAAIEGIESILGPDVSILGGLSTDNMRFVSDFQFVDDRTIEQGVVAVGLADPTIEVAMRANHGLAPVGDPMVVTRSDGYRVVELDGKPAWTRWAESLGLPSTARFIEIGPVPLAMELPPELHEEYGSRTLILIYSGSAPGDGSVHVTELCPEGTRVWLSHRDEKNMFAGLDHMMRSVAGDCNGRKPAAVFHADCNSRGRLYFNQVLKGEILSRMQRPLFSQGEVPWLGMYGGGEFCRLGGRNRVHAFSSSLAVLLRRPH